MKTYQDNNILKGIILAGGLGSRLYPLTKASSKQLLPVYDKPMIYYPMSVLINAGIKDILIISTERDLPRFRELFGDGSKFSLNICYKAQKEPKGIAEAFIIGEKFIGMDDVCLILGDNIFHGKGFRNHLSNAILNLNKNYSTIFSVTSKNPSQFGVIEFKNEKIFRIIEKPKRFISEFIVSGLYFYKNEVVKISKELKPSKRNELEITDLNNSFLKKGKLAVLKLEKDIFWSDTGTYDSLFRATQYMQKKEVETNKKIACLEEILFNKGIINKEQFKELCDSMIDSNYGKYLFNIINN